jgi:TM2 domain-containing membrane protein YozV
MKKYYLHDGQLHTGPFSIEELRNKSITATTPVWYQGLAEWTAAGSLLELSEIINITVPPPFKSQAPPPPPPKPPSYSTAPPQHQNVQINIPPQPYQKWSPGVAAILSLFIPGVGQMYKGDVLTGILWMIIVTIGYFLLVVPGLILHLICILTAASGDPYKSKTNMQKYYIYENQ